MQRRTALVSLLPAVALASACGTDDTTSSTTASTSTDTTTGTKVTAVADPDPATATPSSNASYQWQTSFTVTLTSTAEVVMLVYSLTAKLQQAASGIIITPPTGITESFRFDVRATSNQLAAVASGGTASTLPIGFDFQYTLPNGGRAALVTITFALNDPDGVQTTLTVTAKIA